MFLFFQNSANDNDNDVDNNTNNEDRICHDTKDSQSSSEYESDISDDGYGVLAQPQHRSIRGRELVRVRGGRFCRCGRVGNHGRRADGGCGGGAHAVPRVADQSVKWSDITDFENPNVEKLFYENEEPDTLSMLAGTPLDCLQLLFSDKVFKSIVEQSNRYHEQQSNNGIGDRWEDITIAEMKAFMGILLAMGLVELPKFHDYWARNGVYT